MTNHSDDKRQAQSCPACGPLIREPGITITAAALQDGAATDCATCVLLWNSCKEACDLTRIESIYSWNNGQAVFGLCLLQKKAAHNLRIAIAANGEKNISPFPWLPTSRKSPGSRTSIRDIELARQWLKDCADQHPACNATPTKLPTRVIDVGNSSHDPRLIATGNFTGRYLALSHRWGSSEYRRLITTEDSLHSHTDGIPPKLWPETFRDAIEVTRALGFRHLWIDSLCIIQDDSADWETEVAKMGDTYANAYATIFAERSAHCDDGLFRAQEDASAQSKWVEEIEYRNPANGYTYWILVSKNPTGLLAGTEPEAPFCTVDRARSNLRDRAWVVQEDILSRRKICFSSTELYWLCNQTAKCECGLKLDKDRSWYDISARLLFTRAPEGNMITGLSMKPDPTMRFVEKTDRLWKELVQLYTARELTRAEDRLPALSGLVSKLWMRKNTDYLAGIWRQDITQLLWVANAGGRSSMRHVTYYAPTWSWASVTGPVEFYENCTKFLWDILGITCVPAGENIFGPVSVGWIRISGRAALVTLELENDEDSEPSGSRDIHGKWTETSPRHQRREGNGIRLRISAAGQPSLSCWARRKNPCVRDVRLDSTEDLKYLQRKSSVSGSSKAPEYVLLFAGLYRRPNEVDLDEDTAFPLGLLLRQSRGNPEAWKRLAFVALTEEWAIWRPFTSKRTIVIT